MSKEKKLLLVPFDASGNMLTFASSWTVKEWRDNYVFRDTLRYVQSLAGRSSMAMQFVSVTTGKKYSMFWRYFDKVIRLDCLEQGPTLTCDWTFTKQGSNYSIVPILVEDR